MGRNTILFFTLFLFFGKLYAMQEKPVDLVTEAEQLTAEFIKEVAKTNQAMLLLQPRIKKQKKAHAKKPKRPDVHDAQQCPSSCGCFNCVIS